MRVEVVPGVSISPGSAIFFPAILFAILLVYVLEDELEARRLVYGVLLANVGFAILIALGLPLIAGAGPAPGTWLDPDRALRVSSVLLAGTVVLAIDSAILIRSFEWFGERVSRNVLLRALFALCLSAGVDGLIFSLIAFGSRPRFGTILAVGIAGKMIAASFYSLVFVFLLPWSKLADDRTPLPRMKRAPGSITFKDRFQDLQKVAVRDSLTGVFNRAYFDHELRIQTDRALVRGDGLVLLLIDLDSFKKVNDNYGHPTGDRVLSLFGEALRAAARQNDTVCRYGGEEFAILVSGSPISIASRLFARTTEELVQLWSSATPAFSFAAPHFSVGAAAVPEDAQSALQLLAIADTRLYASKHAGGHRLTFD
jgi:diguanylate cyclase (GGDEF)-like protein